MGFVPFAVDEHLHFRGKRSQSFTVILLPYLAGQPCFWGFLSGSYWLHTAEPKEQMEVLFTLWAERYERGSIMLTSNFLISKWEQIIKDTMTAAAAIDRLVHHCIILELNVPSYRLEESKKRKEESMD